MSAPFEKAIRELLPCADVVFDKFRVEKHLNEGVDNTRRQENGRMLDDVLDGLGEPRDGMTKERQKLEKSLKGWIDGRSTQDIFDWFDCVETTEVRTDAGKFRWSTESIRRDELFLDRLGMPRREQWSG